MKTDAINLIEDALQEAVALLTVAAVQADNGAPYLDGIERIQAAVDKVAAYREMERLRVAMIHEASVRSSYAQE